MSTPAKALSFAASRRSRLPHGVQVRRLNHNLTPKHRQKPILHAISFD